MIETLEAQVARLFEVDGRIATLRAELRQLIDERRKLEEILGQQAVANGRRTLPCVSGTAFVRTKREVHFPTKSEDSGASDRLRMTIRRVDQWDLVSDLSYPRLKSLWLKQDGLPDSLRRAVAPFALERTLTTIRCQAREDGPESAQHVQRGSRFS